MFVSRQLALLLTLEMAVEELLRDRAEQLTSMGEIYRSNRLNRIARELGELAYEIVNPETEDEPAIRTQPCS